MSKRIRRSRHGTNITTAASKPREVSLEEASAAESLSTLRAITDELQECPGCGITDDKPKLLISGFDPHHPKCYQKLVAEWPA